jgi:adenylate cyclase, class 2
VAKRRTDQHTHKMSRETEIKLKVRDPKAFLRALKKLGAATVRPGSGCVHEMNVIFDTEQGALAKRGQLLRIRTETHEGVRRGKRGSANRTPAQRILLTFKLPATPDGHSSAPATNERHKVREELELQVSDAGTLTRVFQGLEMNGWFRYEKYRTTFRLPASKGWAKGLLIELDETPIGTFVELEGPPAAIDRAAEELGYKKHDHIVESYLALYARACRREGKEPGDMLFGAGPKPAARKI